MTTLKLELTIEQVNGLLSILDVPHSGTTMQRTALISLIQEQAGPQVRAIQVAEAKALAEQNEVKDEQ